MREFCHRVLRTACFLVAIGSLPGTSGARDASHYPRHSVLDAGEWVGFYDSFYARVFPLSITMHVDPSFSVEQKTLLDKALNVFVDRAITDAVLDCAFARSYRDLPPSKDHIQSQIFQAITWRGVGDAFYPAFAFIARYWSDPDSVGLGYVNLYYDKENPMPGYDHRHYLHIALNGDHLGSSGYWVGHDPEYWAGVIGHEFLHNLGYDHPTGYPGSFIKEYGNCIWWNGISREAPEGLLEDRAVYKD